MCNSGDFPFMKIIYIQTIWMYHLTLAHSERTYPLRTLACKWSKLLYYWSLIMIMRHYVCDYMLFYYIDSVLLSVQGLDLEDVEALMKPLDSRSSQGVDYWGLIVVYMTYVHLIRCYDYGFYFWHDSLMMWVDDSLSTRLTCGVEGSHMTSRDVEGEVWTVALPQPTSTPDVARTVG